MLQTEFINPQMQNEKHIFLYSLNWNILTYFGSPTIISIANRDSLFVPQLFLLPISQQNLFSPDVVPTMCINKRLGPQSFIVEFHKPESDNCESFKSFWIIFLQKAPVTTWPEVTVICISNISKSFSLSIGLLCLSVTCTQEYSIMKPRTHDL